MLASYEWPFVVALALAAVMVLGSALGVVSDHELDADGDGIPDDLEGIGSWLTAFGFGRAPLGVSLVLLLGTFGAAGLGAAIFVAPLGHGLAALASLSIAIVVALVVHRSLAGFVGRFMPSVETYASRTVDRIGRVGVVVLRLGAGDLIVRVRLDDGTELRVRAASDELDTTVGAQVVIVDHDERAHRDRVVLLPPEARSLPGTNEKENV